MDTPEKSGAIAFICAMPMELSPLVKKLSLTKTEVDGVTVHRGTLDGREVVAIVTGMGTKLATEATERLLDATSVDRVMVVGIAGALENETPIGTLMLPEVVVNSATGTEYRPEPLGEGTRHGKMSTGDTLQTDPDDIAELRAKGVVSLEMETAAIAEICERRGIPWSVFRAISDRPSDKHRRRDVPAQQPGRDAQRQGRRRLLRQASRPHPEDGQGGQGRQARHEDRGRRRHQSRRGHLTPSAPARSLERTQQ